VRNSPLKPGKPLRRTKWRKGAKTARQRLIREADALIQRVAVAMNGGICQFPGCEAQATEGHHVVHRDNFALRWVAANVPGLCHDHHLWDQDASRKGKLLAGLIERMGGQANYDALVLYGNTQPGEDPRDAIERLRGVLDENTGRR
jgi:hypothetical protein